MAAGHTVIARLVAWLARGRIADLDETLTACQGELREAREARLNLRAQRDRLIAQLDEARENSHFARWVEAVNALKVVEHQRDVARAELADAEQARAAAAEHRWDAPVVEEPRAECGPECPWRRRALLAEATLQRQDRRLTQLTARR
jgi:hypothetical protein